MPFRLATAVLLLGLSSSFHAFGQTPIETGPLTVSIEDFAVLPDLSARMSVMTADPAGRLFVNDQRGPLYTISSDGATVIEYLDLRDYSTLQLSSSSEKGFQGFAFHPDFYAVGQPGYGKFYTIHSSSDTTQTPDFDPGGSTSFHTLLLEWTTDTPASSVFVAADAGAPYREILRFKQPYSNHNAGLVAFNTSAGPTHPDRNNLYICIGDGGSGGDPQDNGQDTSNPFAAILRIDPTGNNSANGKYGIVADNVFASDGNAGTLAEIYAYGLRNPQRFGWDNDNGDMYIADIGQGVIEEIDLAVNGGNFGWNNREGSIAYQGGIKTPEMIDPVAEYRHGSNLVSNMPTSITNRAVTLGEVVRGSSIPGLDGNLIISDLPTGIIFYLNVDTDPLDGGQDGLFELIPLDADGNPVRLLDLINQTRASRGTGATTRADVRFSLGIDGEVYIINKHDGVIRRLTAVPIIAKHIFYNNSAFDGNNIAANANDDDAIAADKQVLLPGQTATFANYSSYSKGINGIMIDMVGLPGTPTASDFDFNVGNDSLPASWPAGPAPVEVVVRPGDGVGSSDRVTIIFADSAIMQKWLKVTVKATAATGLSAAKTFYFGNATGDTGDQVGNAIVDAADEINCRNNPRHFLIPAGVEDVNDHNRDGKVDATDEIISRNYTTTFASALRLIDAPAP